LSAFRGDAVGAILGAVRRGLGIVVIRSPRY
jgi:hypothetical protein